MSDRVRLSLRVTAAVGDRAKLSLEVTGTGPGKPRAPPSPRSISRSSPVPIPVPPSVHPRSHPRSRSRFLPGPSSSLLPPSFPISLLVPPPLPPWVLPRSLSRFLRRSIPGPSHGPFPIRPRPPGPSPVPPLVLAHCIPYFVNQIARSRVQSCFHMDRFEISVIFKEVRQVAQKAVIKRFL